jgi:hypothetical protein
MRHLKQIFLLIALLLFVCSRNPGNTAPETENPTMIITEQSQIEKIHYILRNDTIILITSKCECDTITDSKETINIYRQIPFLLNGDSLQIVLSVVDTIGSSGITVTFYKQYVRMQSSGSVPTLIDGSWKLIGDGFSASGELPGADSLVAQRILENSREGFDYLDFSTYQVTIYHILDSLRSLAWHFMQNWNMYYAPLVSVKIDTSINPDTLVVLTGRIRPDTVRIIKDLSNDCIMTTSSDTACPSYTYDPSSINCPNPVYPAWFENIFLANNLKTADTIATIAIVSPRPGDILFIGDTLKVELDFNAPFIEQNTGLTFSLSIDNGLNWYALTCVQSGFPQFRLDKPYSTHPMFVLTESLGTDNPEDGTISPVSEKVIFETVSYSNHSAKAQTTGSISIRRRAIPIQE